jgi:hypothetical protein
MVSSGECPRGYTYIIVSLVCAIGFFCCSVFLVKGVQEDKLKKE